MPMAGLGSRFRSAGELRPKPVIPVLGVPMFRLALGSIRARVPDAEVVCVVLAEHEARAGIATLLAQAEPAVAIAMVPELTGGALETCLAAEPLVRNVAAPAVVLDCDLTFSSPAYCERLLAMQAGTDGAAGLLLSFRSGAPRYSFAEVRDGQVLRTAEKVPISDRALIGAYGFGSAALLFRIAHEMVARNQRTGNGEFYVSGAYNTMIAEGLPVGIVDVEQYWSMGTPEELAGALASPDFIMHVNRLEKALTGAPR